MRIVNILHKPATFSARSGMYPLTESLGAQPVFYDHAHQKLMKRSWQLGEWLRQAGARYYGSTWNSLMPIRDEWRLARQIEDSTDIVHFLWGEFASPVHPEWFRRKARVLVGTFHASARRLPTVLKGFRGLPSYDLLTLMSRAQMPYFIERGISEDRLRVILHGVDSGYFVPAATRTPREGPLRGLMVGKTERDHAMMKAILEKIPDGVLEMTILTAREQRSYYYGSSTPHAVFPGSLSDADLIQAYQQADLLVMPMQDCAANNALLESMACGTPVMVNRVGGAEEYVDGSCNIIIDDHHADAWIEHLVQWQKRRSELEEFRPAVRRWAENFDWKKVAQLYLDMYQTLLTQ